MTQVILQRDNGAQARITVNACFGRGLTVSYDVFVHYRNSEDERWRLLKDRPAHNWREMSVDEYVKHGRSEMLTHVSPGEILHTVVREREMVMNA